MYKKKRLGDHGQIAFARRFPFELVAVVAAGAARINDFYVVFDDAGDAPQAPLPNQEPAPPTRFAQPPHAIQTLDPYTIDLISHRMGPDPESIIRKGTYFLTGDWPAFNYAVYNQVNSIMHVRTPPSTMLAVDFN